MPDPEMMKTSVFALDQQGSLGGEGRGKGRDWFCSLSPSAEPGVDPRKSQAQCRLPLTPGRGRPTGGGVSAPAITLLGGQP